MKAIFNLEERTSDVLQEFFGIVWPVTLYKDMFIYSFRNGDIFSGIHFFCCHGFTAFKQSKSDASWLNRKIQYLDGESPIPK